MKRVNSVEVKSFVFMHSYEYVMIPSHLLGEVFIEIFGPRVTKLVKGYATTP